LLVHDRGRRFVRLDQIIVVSSLGGNYTTVELDDGSVPAVRRTLKAWEDRLPKAVFRRVHRGTIANLRRVEQFERSPDGTLLLRLRNRGDPLPVSRRRSTEVQTALAAND
jgi:DNA-binding LytR/AlgR family response regulator